MLNNKRKCVIHEITVFRALQTLHLFHRLLFHGNNSSLHHCALTFVGRLFIILPNLSRGLVSGFDEIFLGGWDYNVNWSKINVSSVSFSSEWMVLIRSDEGLTPETSALETPYDGQFTLSTQVIKPNELITAPIDTASQFLWKLPYLFD